MIQRIQSLYLVAGALLLALFVALGSTWATAIAQEQAWLGTLGYVLAGVTALVALVAVFLYKNRELQRKVIHAAQWLDLALVVAQPVEGGAARRNRFFPGAEGEAPRQLAGDVGSLQRLLRLQRPSPEAPVDPVGEVGVPDAEAGEIAAEAFAVVQGDVPTERVPEHHDRKLARDLQRVEMHRPAVPQQLLRPARPGKAPQRRVGRHRRSMAAMIVGEDVEAFARQLAGKSAIASGVLGKAVEDENDAARLALGLRPVEMQRRAGPAVEGFFVVETQD